jgi:nucleotide-binding universal stress UspA family protein
VASGPSIVCPVDFSDASGVALRYAAAVATYFRGRLAVVTVNDPILAETAELRLGPDWLGERCHRELESFLAATFPGGMLEGIEVRHDVVTGKAAPEILRVARESGADLIVMSSHGLSGFRKLFFGATTERVLRETTVPVLVTPPSGPGPSTVEEAAGIIKRILVPVDLVTSPSPQVQMAETIADALNVPILLVHVIEPLRSPAALQPHLPNVDAERRTQADQALASIVAAARPGAKVEGLTAYGDSAEEIAKIAKDRQAGLVVMGLHASPVMGSRMGSVTYRVLCLAHGLVLALPPRQAEAAPA